MIPRDRILGVVAGTIDASILAGGTFVAETADDRILWTLALMRQGWSVELAAALDALPSDRVPEISEFCLFVGLSGRTLFAHRAVAYLTSRHSACAALYRDHATLWFALDYPWMAARQLAVYAELSGDRFDPGIPFEHAETRAGVAFGDIRRVQGDSASFEEM